MTEKAGVAYLYLIICELCELCEQMPPVYFLRKVSMFSGKVANKKKCEVYATRKPYRGHRHRAAASALSLAAPCAQQRPLYPRRVYRHERDGGDHRFSRYSESGEAANRTEIVSPTNEQYENRSKMRDITISKSR